MARLGLLRVAAALLPAALLLHEAVYAVGGEADTGSHGYLAEVLPLLAVLGGSFAVAALLLPGLRGGAGSEDGPVAAVLRPVAIALALLALFLIQEGAEIALLGGGVEQLAAVMAASWLLLPVALLLGALGAAYADWLGRAGLRLAVLIAGSGRPRPRRRPAGARRTPATRRAVHLFSPLAFGLARRPPPALI
jgi:hypothetical protein